MSKSRKQKKHFMESNDQMDMYRTIRKPMPPATKVINPKSKGRWDWRDDIDELDDIDDSDDSEAIS